MNNLRSTFGLFALAVVLMPFKAMAVDPPVNPGNGSGAKEFNWQDEWGTIHMNSLADGLNDPGSPASSNGSVGCPTGGLCKDGKVKSSVNTGFPTQIGNGIKFDIKNSLLNCMSKVVTNWAVYNPWDSDTTVCLSQYGLYPPKDKAHDAHTLLYLPIYDRRSNDGREWQNVSEVGCQQQIINNCARDEGGNEIIREIHQCIQSPSSDYQIPPPPAFAAHPVTHVFTKEEVQDLGTSQMPNTYYIYQKDLGGNKSRQALTTSDPSTLSDRVKDSHYTKVDVGSDPNLARIKSYRFSDTDSRFDKKDFIIVDPSDFFDLRLYTESGKYAAGYDKFDKNGNVMTYDTCPVLGLVGGYSGICDPTGKAGCNIPIYEVGDTTTFSEKSGKTFTTNDYPIRWSGYSKKWAILTVDEYKKNVKGRERIYLTDDADLNDNPVVMLTRADEYCEDLERTSDVSAALFSPNSPPAPDMPCIHYLQYQATDDTKSEYTFVDLYYPGEAQFSSWNPEYNTLQLYHLDAEGKPKYSSPVAGTGSDKYLSGGSGSKSGFASFFDTANDGRHIASVYSNASTGGTNLPAVYKANYSGNEPVFANGKRVSGPVRDTRGNATTGEYLGADVSKGTGISLFAGTASVIRLPANINIGTEKTSCAMMSYLPPESSFVAGKPLPKVFIPTNSKEELQAFIDATQGPNPPIQGLSLRKCSADYQNNADILQVSPNTQIPAGAQTWTGMVTCDSLSQRPACNETKLIRAQRFCQLENGSLDSCEKCINSVDPDKKMNFSEAAVGGMILNQKNKCYFLASCFNNSAEGCPTSGTSGGHVFCLSADTKITMADGSQKDIKSIKAGEEVVTFNAKQSRNGQLSKGVVKATAITKKQKVVKINDLRITPLHKIVLANGRAVAAKDIKVGDKILKADGLMETVKSVKTDLAPITVYNLVLENGSDGYIANGVKVMSYPIPKGMDASRPKHYERNLSSVKSPAK